MGYRNIFLSSCGKLSLKREQLVFVSEEETLIPLEDINSVMIENRQIVITAALLERLSKNGICVYFCDEYHLPTAVLLPYHSHSRQLKVLEAQLKATKPFKKQRWKEIIIQKIINQGTVLMLLGKREAGKKLEAMAVNVKSGDSTHLEAQAAAFYFKALFHTKFTRGSDNLINAALNYGYALLRGQIARNLAVYGFEPCLGICHHSELNAFNLADDLIEIYRPVVDLFVGGSVVNMEEERLTPELKQKLFQLLSMDVLLDGKYYSVSYAIERTVQSYSSILLGRGNTLKLCDIIPLELHRYE